MKTKTSKKVKTKYKFNPFQKAWIKTLIAQKFKQTSGQLTVVLDDNDIACCCLGVACEIAPKFGYKIESTIIGNTKKYNHVTLSLPPILTKGLKLFSNIGTFINGVNGRESLSDLNDDAKWSHKRIGEYMLKHPEKVFVDAV